LLVETSLEDTRNDAELAEFLMRGVAIGIATCDEHTRPFFARGFGPELADDGRSLRLCVTAPHGSEVRRNLERGCRIAIGVAIPTAARAIQLKGTVEAVAEPDTADRERIARHLDAFVPEAAAFGMPEALVRRYATAVELVAVSCSIDETYDQTPGPAAGRRR
jgi:hypothetical protein